MKYFYNAKTHLVTKGLRVINSDAHNPLVMLEHIPEYRDRILLGGNILTLHSDCLRQLSANSTVSLVASD